MTGWVLVGMLALSGGIYDRTFAEGVSLYEQGQFEESAQRFGQLVREGVEHPAVFYNLGNVRYRMGDLAGAIVEYERAMRLDPGIEGLRQNLTQCISETKRPLERPRPSVWEQSLFFWHAGLAPRTVRLAALTSWVLFWLILALRYGRRLPYLGAMALVVLVVALACTASVLVKSRPSHLLVANAEVVPVCHGTSEHDTVRFELYLGDRVVFDRRKDDWVRVTAADGERGWAKVDSFLPVGPPYVTPVKKTATTGTRKATE